jgi:HEAT repeat protein
MSKNFKEVLIHVAGDDRLHTGYLYALSSMGYEDLVSFKEIWPTVETQRRRDVIQELTDIAEVNFEVDFEPIFLLGMGDDDAIVRETSVKSLWDAENPDTIRPLIHLLKQDPASEVREASALTLGKFVYLKELEEIDPVEAGLAEEALFETIYQATENINVRRRALEAISFSGDPRIGPLIEAAYYSDETKMQVSAIFAMGRNADISWLPTVITELDNPNSEIRFEACRACGELEATPAVDKLIELIEYDADIEVQEMAIWALGRIGGDTAREALEICVEDENEAIAAAAEEALDELNIFSDGLMLYDFSEYMDEDDVDFDANDPDSARFMGLERYNRNEYLN